MTLELLLGIIGAVGTIVVPFLLFAMSRQSERMKTMEDRIFDMNGSHVTQPQLKAELRELEGRVNLSLAEKWDSVRHEIQSLKELMMIVIKQKE